MECGSSAPAFAISAAPTRSPFAAKMLDSFSILSAGIPFIALPQSLHPTYRRPNKSKRLAELVLQESLIRKMQRLLLVRKHKERRRRNFRLGYVINPDRPRLWQRPALQLYRFQ